MASLGGQVIQSLYTFAIIYNLMNRYWTLFLNNLFSGPRLPSQWGPRAWVGVSLWWSDSSNSVCHRPRHSSQLRQDQSPFASTGLRQAGLEESDYFPVLGGDSGQGEDEEDDEEEDEDKERLNKLLKFVVDNSSWEMKAELVQKVASRFLIHCGKAVWKIAKKLKKASNPFDLKWDWDWGQQGGGSKDYLGGSFWDSVEGNLLSYQQTWLGSFCICVYIKIKRPI